MKKLIFKIIFVIFFTTNLASEEVLKIGISEYLPFSKMTAIPTYYNSCAYHDNTPGFEYCLKHLHWTGAEIDLIQYLCGGSSKTVKFDKINRIGFQCEIVEIDFDKTIPSLKNKEIDVIIAAMSIKPERQIEIDFSIPYFVFEDGSATAVGIRKNENDLKSKIDSAISEAINEDVIKKISIEWWQTDFTPK
jgi:ABC-type amino acid transport substrate-binding protein